MSRTRVYKPETLAVQERFFEVLQELADAKRLPGGVNGFCECYGIDRRHLYTQRANRIKGYFEVAWVVPLVKYFGVSANWLLLGTGKKFKRSSTPKAETE